MKVMLIVFALLLAGCAASSSTAGSGHRARPVCGALAPSSEAVPLEGFTVSWVLRCPVPVYRGPQLTQRAEGPATEVLRQLKMPDDPVRDSCTAIGLTVPDYVLVDAAGNGIQPTLPTDGCHLPKRSVLDALDALPYRTIKTENR
jgi:hypothetical protein